MSFKQLCFLFTAAIFLSSKANADLLSNGSFEAPSGYAVGSQNVMPPGWQNTDGTSPDLYSSDGSFALAPGDFGNFPGVTAQDQLGWVAGAGSNGPGGETFGQFLANPLQPNSQYVFSAYLHQAKRFDLNNPGAYEVLLNSSNTLVGAVHLFAMDPTTDADNWEFRTNSFFAPANSDLLPWIIFRPYASVAGSSYPGLDNAVLTGVPEPTSGIFAIVALLGVTAVRCGRIAMCS